MPERIQRRRTKGYKLPEGAAYVGRPTKWGNPFSVEPCDSRCCWVVSDPAGIAERSETPNRFSTEVEARAHAVELYELHTGPMGSYELDVEQVRQELGGRDLACWCPLPAEGEPDHCHASVLLVWANEGVGDA